MEEKETYVVRLNLQYKDGIPSTEHQQLISWAADALKPNDGKKTVKP